MDRRRESLDSINMTPVLNANVATGSRSEPATPAPTLPECMDTSISMEEVAFRPIPDDYHDMRCPACFETEWITRAHIFAECGHRYHMDCFEDVRNMNEGHPKCPYCNRYLFTPESNVNVDERGIRIPSPPPDPRTLQQVINETRELQERFDAEDRDHEVDELLDSPPERVPPSNAPRDGTYHEPNARGEIPFTPNDSYGNGSRDAASQSSQLSQTVHSHSTLSTRSNSTANSTFSPYRPGCRIISRRLNESFSQAGGGREYLVLVENADGSRRNWREYHPAGAPRLVDIVNGQEIPHRPQEDRPRTPRGSDPRPDPPSAASAVISGPHRVVTTSEPDILIAASADEPVVLDAADEPVVLDAADEPVAMDDNEVQVVQQVVGNAGNVVVDVESEHPDDEPIGLAALEQMGLSDGDEQGANADAAGAAVADVDEADAEAAQYLAEVEADNGGAAAAVDAEEQFRAELETGAGAEPDAEQPRDDAGADSMPELESMEED